VSKKSIRDSVTAYAEINGKKELDNNDVRTILLQFMLKHKIGIHEKSDSIVNSNNDSNENID